MFHRGVGHRPQGSKSRLAIVLRLVACLILLGNRHVLAEELAFPVEVASRSSSGSADGTESNEVKLTSFASGLPTVTSGCEPCGESFMPGTNEPRGFVRAWLSQGYTANGDDPADGFNTPVTFNDFADEYQMNQLYLSVGREVSQCGPMWDVGAQVDLLYGTDYFFTTALGLETELDGTQRWNGDQGPRAFGASRYGLAMPQLFFDVYAPVGNGVNVRVGHFYSILGYESVMATENFFYSHAYAMQYAQPFTHTGVLTTFQLAGGGSLNAGFTRGWDNWEDPNGELGFLGGINASSFDGRTKISFGLHSSNEDAAGQNTRTSYSLVVARRVSGCLTYVLQHDFGIEQAAALRRGRLTDAKWYGINHYLLADLSPCVKFGLRAEWFRDQNNARVIGIPTDAVDGGNYFAITAGLNYSVNDFMILRPELRWDWSDVESNVLGLGGPFNAFTEEDQVTAAADLVIRF